MAYLALRLDGLRAEREVRCSWKALPLSAAVFVAIRTVSVLKATVPTPTALHSRQKSNATACKTAPRPSAQPTLPAACFISTCVVPNASRAATAKRGVMRCKLRDDLARAVWTSRLVHSTATTARRSQLCFGVRHCLFACLTSMPGRYANGIISNPVESSFASLSGKQPTTLSFLLIAVVQMQAPT